MFKILVIGNISVGKTCLVNRLAHNTFTERYHATVACDFASAEVVIDERVVKV
jgi:GTPase SAR1 family protein